MRFSMSSHARSCEIYWEELKVALNPRLRIFLSFSLLLIISSCRGQCALFSPHVQPGSHLSTPHICHFFLTIVAVHCCKYLLYIAAIISLPLSAQTIEVCRSDQVHSLSALHRIAFYYNISIKAIKSQLSDAADCVLCIITGLLSFTLFSSSHCVPIKYYVPVLPQ